MTHILDLNFLGFQQAIACFLIETDDGPVLIETGPHSTFGHLSETLKSKGFEVRDVRHVLLSHIHLDHAGAAWAFAKHGARVYLHPAGAPHMQRPQKLMESARRIYQDQMDRLWGEMHEIPEQQLQMVKHEEIISIGGKDFVGLHTPGHAQHHIAWQLEDTVFTGDVAGVKIDGGPVVPPCPPPDINIEEWLNSIDLILEKQPNNLQLTHFGKITQVQEHFESLRKILEDWSQWIQSRWEAGMTAEEMTPQFSKYTADQLRSQGVSERGIQQYEAANPSWMSVAGLIRYWKKKLGE
ncbi:MAG: MBL fold metallo-hydrolase [Cyclobacteriaceae bacterium]|nr:MBL fold metallo-hydrolase [Cyclobacteriaceae bacterium HetDA_MAG_MS6]